MATPRAVDLVAAVTAESLTAGPVRVRKWCSSAIAAPSVVFFAARVVCDEAKSDAGFPCDGDEP